MTYACAYIPCLSMSVIVAEVGVCGHTLAVRSVSRGRRCHRGSCGSSEAEPSGRELNLAIEKHYLI